MFKLFSRLILSLLLLVAQQGAVLHELSHFAQPGSQQEREHDQHAVGDLCTVCLAFSQVGTAAPPQVQRPVLLAGLAYQAVPALHIPVRPLDLPATRSRGPPPAL